MIVFDCRKLDNQTKELFSKNIMNYKYDASSEQCPLPLVKLRVILKKMTAGDTCSFRIKDNGSKSDIPRLLDKLQCCYTVSVDEAGVEELFITYR